MGLIANEAGPAFYRMKDFCGQFSLQNFELNRFKGYMKGNSTDSFFICLKTGSHDGAQFGLKVHSLPHQPTYY